MTHIDDLPPNVKEAFLAGLKMARFVAREAIAEITDPEDLALNQGSRLGEALTRVQSASVAEYRDDEAHLLAVKAEIDSHYGEGLTDSVVSW